MDETQLHALRQDPSPEFADRLRARLRAEPDSHALVSSRWPVIKIAASVALVVAVGGLFSVPAVRASAQAFLAKFRVVNFVAVPVDSSRLFALQSQNLRPTDLIGNQWTVLEDPGPETAVVSLQQAGSLAGFDVGEPSYLPPDAAVTGITVKGQHRLRVTADVARLQQAMDALGIRDLTVPEGLDGQDVTVRIPPVVTMIYERGGERAAQFMQAQTPEVLLPGGVNLTVLGEIGLRILGLPANEAHQFAQTIDWHTTLLVPVPPAATSFKQVNINGAQGVEIERVVTNPETGYRTRIRILAWSAGGRVFGIESVLGPQDVLQMASSVR